MQLSNRRNAFASKTSAVSEKLGHVTNYVLKSKRKWYGGSPLDYDKHVQKKFLRTPESQHRTNTSTQ